MLIAAAVVFTYVSPYIKGKKERKKEEASRCQQKRRRREKEKGCESYETVDAAGSYGSSSAAAPDRSTPVAFYLSQKDLAHVILRR